MVSVIMWLDGSVQGQQWIGHKKILKLNLTIEKMFFQVLIFRYGERRNEREEKKLQISTPRNDFRHEAHIGIK